MKVWLYLRKSTDSEDQQALSLQKQRDACEELLRGLGDYEIVQTWEESISAKTSGLRPWFKEMVKMIEKGRIDTIVTWKMNRLGRNPLDQAYIETYLQEWKIKMIVSQDWVFRTWDNILLMRIFFWMWTQYSIDLGKDASQWMLQKVKWWQPVKVPRGYDFDKHKKAIQNIEAVAIRDIFKLKRDWYSLSEIAQTVFHTHGLALRDKPLATSTIHNILTNPFYYGGIKYMWEIYTGTYEPIVSYSEWQEANETHWAKVERTNMVDFARNLVFNHESGNALCPFLSKGNLYFRSTEREWPKINISFTRIRKYFDAHIHLYNIPEEIKPMIIEWFREFYKWKHGDIESRKEIIHQELVKIDRKRASLLDMRMNEELDSAEYKKLKNELSDRYFQLSEEVQNLVALSDDILTKSEECFKLMSNIEQEWKNSNFIRQASIIKLLCFKLSVDNQKALHLAERELFELVRCTYDSIWLSIRDNLQTTPLSSLYMAMVLFVKRDYEKVDVLR